MKVQYIPAILVALLAVDVTAQTNEGRTLVNGEGSPFVYLFLSRSEVQGETTADSQSLVELLRRRSRHLNELAPHGMWRIPQSSGLVVGYFAGGPSAVSFHLVRMSVGPGRNPILVHRDAVITEGGSPVAIAPWDLPATLEPVALDGMDSDWETIAPAVRYAAFFVPPRIENAIDGSTIEVGDTVFWQRGGTAVRTVRSTVGNEWWFTAIEAGGSIADGTAYHLRAFPDRDDGASRGEFSVVIAGESGPVVYRSEGGTVELAGQYVRRNRFVEFSIARDFLDRLAAEDADLSFDIASSRRGPRGTERFTFGTVDAPEVLTR